jgi:hypothetical protein
MAWSACSPVINRIAVGAAGPGGADGGLYDWYVNPSEVSRPIDELVSTTRAIIIGRGVFGAGGRRAQRHPSALPR